MVSPVADLGHLGKTAVYQAFSDMKAEISSGMLGMVWWILEPVLYLGVFYFIFAVLDLRGGVDAIPFLLPALVAWKWFSMSVFQGSIAINKGASLMQQIYIPKYFFVVTSIIGNLCRFLVVFFLLLVFLLVYGLEPSSAWLALPAIIIVQLILVLGIAGFISALLPFIPDLRVVITNGLTLVFFLSGIFFDISIAPEPYRQILHLNPLAILIDAYRSVFLDGIPPDWNAIAVVAVFSVFLVLLAYKLISKWDREYPKVLS